MAKFVKGFPQKSVADGLFRVSSTKNGENKMSKKVLGTGHYSKRVYLKASRTGAAIRTSRGTVGSARKHFRDDLRKWATPKAVSENPAKITDPRKLVPYRGANYGTIVETLLSKLPTCVSGLTGTLTQDCSTILEWSGLPANKEIQGIVSTPWISTRNLFEQACKRNNSLTTTLKSRKSNRPGVKKANRTTSPLEKFENNIVTLQRTGGVNPYAKPLMDCGYAIDHRWVMSSGKPCKEVRLVVGRSKPINMRKTDLE